MAYDACAVAHGCGLKLYQVQLALPEGVRSYEIGTDDGDASSIAMAHLMGSHGLGAVAVATVRGCECVGTTERAGVLFWNQIPRRSRADLMKEEW